MKVLTMGVNSPLKFSPALSEDFSRPVYIKREDLLYSEFGSYGHAVRKMSFLIPDMQTTGATDVILVGRYGSHFIRVAARALACLSTLKIHCVFTNEFDPAYTSFMSDLHMCNATTYGTYLGTSGMDQVNALTSMVKETGGVPYVLLYEGTNSLACMGGFGLFDELLVDLYTRLLVEDGAEIGDCTVYTPVDTGSSLVGMVAAREVALLDGRLKNKVELVGVGSTGTLQEHQSFISDNFKALDILSRQQEFPLPDLETSQFTLAVYDDIALQDKIDFIKSFYRRTGIMLDPVYGYPTVSCMCSDLSISKHTTPVILINPAPLTRPYFSYNTTPDASGS